MRPVVRRAKLPPDSWWIVHADRSGRVIVILDTAVPAGSIAEQYLIRAALNDWREHRRRVVLFTPAAVLGVMLLVGAAGVLVWVLAGSTSVLRGTVERPAVAGRVPDMSREVGPRPAGGGSPPGSALARPRGMSRMPAASSSPLPSQPSSSSPVPVVPVERETASPPVTVTVSRPRPARRPLRRVLPSPVVPLRPCELLNLPVGHCVRR